MSATLGELSTAFIKDVMNASNWSPARWALRPDTLRRYGAISSIRMTAGSLPMSSRKVSAPGAIPSTSLRSTRR